MIRFVPLAAVVALIAFVASAARAQQWTEYRPDGAGYRIEFPGTPTEDVRDVPTNIGTIKVRTSAVEVGEKVFMTIHSVYPANVSMGDPQKNLDGARNGGVKNVSGTLRTEEKLNVGDAPARRLVIDIPRHNRAADALMVLNGHQLLQAIYVGPRGTEGAPEARRFLASFTLMR